MLQMRGIVHALEKQSAVLARAPEVLALVKSLQVSPSPSQGLGLALGSPRQVAARDKPG